MKKETVLLLHGLGETSLRMLPISLYLQQAGYMTYNLDYPSTIFSAETLSENYLAPIMQEMEKEEVLHIVTHSTGGLLVRHYLEHNKQKNLGRVVMLAPAHKGSEMMEVLRYNPLFALLYGPSGQQSGTGTETFPN